ncbi:hypothetical protein FNAPI_1617 [Fusarium napiforme]|uniref:Uncharacterized protein n=1 Tax=Fusarium napiforme TaxID=42672 RepID=A0A8H5K293_9HYPO|nr:hypothetical protein FNAPI_1617 [Fusarium napiforme]
MKFTSTSLALLASIPLVYSLPTTSVEDQISFEIQTSIEPQTTEPEPTGTPQPFPTNPPRGYDDINGADPDDWLKAVREEATRQAAADGNTGNSTGPIQAGGGWIYKVHAMYTDKLVNVGDVDTFYMFWTRMYDVSDDKGGLSDVTRGAWSKFCNPPDQKDGVTDTFVLDGQWGAVGRLTGWAMRDALIHSMWKTADSIGQKNGYTVYNNCYGFTWQEGRPGRADSACGGRSGKPCPHNSDCPLEGMECLGMKWGTWMPSIIRINVYNRDGSLRADAYQARISSQAPGSGGCSKAEQIAALVAGFSPIVGPYFSAGIRLHCLFL